MNIAIVDDDPTLRISLRHFLHKWHTDNNLPLKMDEYDDGEEFLDSLQSNKYDIVFMDIFMEKKNGIDTATDMRKIDKNMVLVFLTSSSEHMPDAFSVHAFGYLLKPLLPEKLYRVMNDIKAVISPEEEPCLLVTNGKLELSIKYSDIVYINSDSNYCIIHCPEPTKCRGPFSTLCEPLLEHPDFCLINRGILVGLAHVKDTDLGNCIMDNGDQLPLNTKKTAAIKLQIAAYKFEHR